MLSIPWPVSTKPKRLLNVSSPLTQVGVRKGHVTDVGGRGDLERVHLEPFREAAFFP
jgi:nitrogen regulatory protein PII